MIQTTLEIDGMMCGMCEAHINDAVRRSSAVKSVKSSYKNGICVIRTMTEPDLPAIRKAIEETGYRVLSVKKEAVEKKGLFSFLKK